MEMPLGGKQSTFITMLGLGGGIIHRGVWSQDSKLIVSSLQASFDFVHHL